MWNNLNYSYYGSFRTRTFDQHFPTYVEFRDVISDFALASELNLLADDYKKLHFLLSAKYGQSHVASQDYGKFYKMLQYIIYKEYPIYKKKKETLKTLLALEEDAIREGNVAIYNHALNPGELGINTEERGELLDYINDQNVSKNKSNRIIAYDNYLAMLNSVEDEFLNQFRNLFIKVVTPMGGLYFEETSDDEYE